MSWLKLLAPQKLLIAVVEWRIFAAAFFGLPSSQYYVYAYEAAASAPCKLGLVPVARK